MTNHQLFWVVDISFLKKNHQKKKMSNGCKYIYKKLIYLEMNIMQTKVNIYVIVWHEAWGNDTTNTSNQQNN